jgi:uncharacterized protein
MERVTQRARRACAAALGLLWTVVPLALGAQQDALPKLSQPVNDFAGVIDRESAATLDREIRALESASGDVVVVATVKTFAPYGSIEEYAVQLYESAGIGAHDKDNGALILVAVDDRRVRIEVGYGLEGFITDGYAGDLIRRTLLPAFRQGDYGPGLVDATTEIVTRIARERGVTLPDRPVVERATRGRGTHSGGGAGIAVLVFIIFILFLIGRSGGGRGGRGGRRGRGTDALLGFLIGQALAGGRRGGGWSGWNGGFGGGGGGFGGGFGGFGGGRSGGGGASGGW